MKSGLPVTTTDTTTTTQTTKNTLNVKHVEEVKTGIVGDPLITHAFVYICNGYTDMTCHINNTPYQDHFSTHPITNTSTYPVILTPFPKLLQQQQQQQQQGAPWMMGVPVLQQSSEVAAVRYHTTF